MASMTETATSTRKVDDAGKHVAKGLKRHLFLGLGIIMVALGAIGMVFPILPTTPFILLASACFTRSSERFYKWLHESPRFKNFFEKKGITARGKVTILAWAWLVLVLGAIFTPADWVKLLLVAIGVIKTVVFTLFIKTVPAPQPRLEAEREPSNAAPSAVKASPPS